MKKIPQIQNKVPLWVLIVSIFFVLLWFLVSSTLIFSPESVLTNVDLQAKWVQYLVYMWAARQFAMACIFGYSIIKHSFPMLLLSYIFFLIMNICDVLIWVSQNDNWLAGGALFMCLIAWIMIYQIQRFSR